MSGNWLPGEVATITLSATDVAGQLVDPGVVRLLVKPPTGPTVTHTYGASAVIVRDGVGLYHAEVALPTIGIWAFRWESDAPHVGAGERSLTVRPSLVI